MPALTPLLHQSRHGGVTARQRREAGARYGMPPLTDAAAFDRVTEPLLRSLGPEQAMKIVDFHGDEALQERIEELAGKANEGELTDAERAEYEGYIHANDFIATLQAKARRLLAS
jgi:hypothetical protein